MIEAIAAIPLLFFFKGLLVGFAIAAPVGPTAIILVRRTLNRGWGSGCASGLGAAAADAIFGFVAAFGLTLVGDFLVAQRSWLAFCGGVLLIALAVASWRSRVAERNLPNHSGNGVAGLIGNFVSVFILTLANPMTILSFAAVIAAIGALPEDTDAIVDPLVDYPKMAALVGGVFLGSLGWWFALVAITGTVRHRLNDSWLKSFNRYSAVGLFVFGVYVLYEAFAWAFR